ncbi:hypothetical protein B0A50_04076 [Salinomyces thailandicus]|uniref:Uncharacterized protein n=1 Tax=Salinomyces thailandicus TaxID=706561 RepID=A0A4U0TZJ1_9PEZI|nr:hypothetical protein B0A50_04076 [Salinomyces thailandica]
MAAYNWSLYEQDQDRHNLISFDDAFFNTTMEPEPLWPYPNEAGEALQPSIPPQTAANTFALVPPFSSVLTPGTVPQGSWTAPTILPTSYIENGALVSWLRHDGTRDYEQSKSQPAVTSEQTPKHLSPSVAERHRLSRATPLASAASSAPSPGISETSRSTTPNAQEMSKWI